MENDIMLKRIEKHTENLAILQVETENLFDAVEEQTGEAKEKLTRYQELKRQAKAILEEVSKKYFQARSIFRMGDKLLEKLSIIRTNQDKLLKEVIQLKRSGSKDAEIMLDKLEEARAQINDLVEQVEAIKNESIINDDEDLEDTQIAENLTAKI
jgi:hypothetical protein